MIVGVGNVNGVSDRGYAQGMLEQRCPERAVPVTEVEQSAPDQCGDFTTWRAGGNLDHYQP